MLQTTDTSILQVISGALLGLFGGVGATAIWEGLIRPAVDRRNLARSITTEIWLNRERVEKAVEVRRENEIPFNLRFSTVVFQSVAGRLAELPEEILPELIRLYHRFESVNALRTRAFEKQDLLDSSDGQITAQIKADLENIKHGLDNGLRLVSEDIQELMPKLLQYSRFVSGAWSPNHQVGKTRVGK